MFRLLGRSLLLLVFAGSVTSNILLLTSTTFNAAVSTALAATMGVRTVSSALSAKLTTSQSRNATRAAATRKFGRSLAARTSRVAARSLAAVPAEAVPYVGAAVIVGTLSYELYEACQTLNDLNGLYTSLGINEEVPADALSYICDPPSLDELIAGEEAG
ncbi:MAG: hypothetical protein AAF194_05830 [Pseudomonadota bacterium]